MARAFVVGNGPSLRDTDLDLMRGEVSFGLNRVHLHYPHTDWRPAHWVYTDVQDSPGEQWLEDILLHTQQGYHCFVWSNLATMVELRRHRTEPWEPDKTVRYIQLCSEHVAMDIDSPGRPASWHLPTLCKFGTGAAVALQLAAIAGYNPIYLVGMDLGFTEDGPNHFTGDYGVEDKRLAMSGADRKNATHVYAHRLAMMYTGYMGIEIINATVGGELEVYPRVDYGGLFNGNG